MTHSIFLDSETNLKFPRESQTFHYRPKVGGIDLTLSSLVSDHRFEAWHLTLVQICLLTMLQLHKLLTSPEHFHRVPLESIPLGCMIQAPEPTQ